MLIFADDAYEILLIVHFVVRCLPLFAFIAAVRRVLSLCLALDPAFADSNVQVRQVLLPIFFELVLFLAEVLLDVRMVLQSIN